MFADLRTQFNVIGALTIHELQGLMKTYNYGFAWALFEPFMFIAVMRVVKSAFKGLPPGVVRLSRMKETVPRSILDTVLEIFEFSSATVALVVELNL